VNPALGKPGSLPISLEIGTGSLLQQGNLAGYE
jgi:hypothetical protein